MEKPSLEVVEEEVARALSVADPLPNDLKAVFERHCDNLVKLARSLEAAGMDSETIRSAVATLLKTYESDLLKVIEARL
ncbi:hypothetical protein [Falsirhodobacter deserti]|uniref:hypothetical protein n=1 Tax=Falsirhodobacter deserti TaxID=1365611 RepID=UPI000FE3110F|nr:hypothetical protein [Falsirhodobacter deserti]